MSDFIIINKKCHGLFSLSTKSKKPYEKDKSYPVKLFKEKLYYIIMIMLGLLYLRNKKNKNIMNFYYISNHLIAEEVK